MSNMALTICKECTKEVSSIAKVCPHCGVDNPGSTSSITLGHLFVVAIFIGVCWWLYEGGIVDNSPLPTLPENLEAEKTNLSAALVERKRTLVSELGERAIWDCEHCPVLVKIPSGEFMMGGNQGAADTASENQPQHSVSVKGFALAAFELTIEEFAIFNDASGYNATGDGCFGFLGKSQSLNWRDTRFPQTPSQPVTCVSWSDAHAYVQWLSRTTGEPYRLPSEAEWEYAARAESTTSYSWGDEVGNNQANCSNCASVWDFKQTAPVGSFLPNAFGLYDMHGNVWEFVQDCWKDSYDQTPVDGSASASNCSSNSAIVIRGGSWADNSNKIFSSFRYGYPRAFRSHTDGIRIARDITDK